MPYYSKINTLFIHIPKTGGSSIEDYLKKKSPQQLLTGQGNNVFPINTHMRKYSLQHQALMDIETHKQLFPSIIFDKNLKIISIVRNPYDRVISALKFNKLLNNKQLTSSNKKKIYNIIKDFVESPYEKYDNHNRPQYQFLINNENQIDKRVTIYRTETLTQDLHHYGFTDYGGKQSSSKYIHLFNKESIELINKIYDLDFKFFNYPKKEITQIV